MCSRLSLLLLFLVVHSTVSAWQRLPACPDYKVCAIFTCDICEVDGKKEGDLTTIQGFLWAPDSVCQGGTYAGFFARLDIAPVSLRKWNFSVETLSFEQHESGMSHQHIYNIGFDFGNATITFETDKDNIDQAKFTIKMKEHLSRYSYHNLTFGSFRKINGVHPYKSYKFEIETDGEKLLDILGGVEELLFFKTDSKDHFRPLKDKRFAQRLKQISQCDDSELKRVCYDTCDEMEDISTAPGAFLNCSSSLWFHSPSEAGLNRQWHIANNITCHNGGWVANTTEGPEQIDHFEVQCSATEPARATTLMRIVLGVGIGGGILLIIIVIFCVCLCMGKCHCLFKGRNENDETKKSSTKRSASDKAHTPNTGKSNRPSTDIEGLETERISKDKTTNREGIKSWMNTKKWNETHGVASKPSTPAIYCPPPPMQPTKPQEPKGAAAAAGPPLPKGFASQTIPN